MSVVESCRKIEYDAFFMMIFIPVSNFGDQPLDVMLVGKNWSEMVMKWTCISHKFCPTRSTYLLGLVLT